MKKVLNFLVRNPFFVVSAVIYYIVTALWLDNFVIASAIYLGSMIVVFSPIGEKIFRLMNRIRKLETIKEKMQVYYPFQSVLIHAIGKDISIKSNIEAGIIDDMSINACAVGRRTVAVTKGAIEAFTDDELRGIMAHELGHIVNGDTIVSMYSYIGNGLFSIAVVLIKLIIMVIDIVQYAFTENALASIVIRFTHFIFGLSMNAFMFLTNIAMSFQSRKSEYRADKYAYDIGFGEELLNALKLLEKISVGDNSSLTEKMIASHPRITKRIQRLEKLIENEKNYN